MGSMGFAQPRLMGTFAAFVELFGGLAFAVGFLTPIAAALLVVDMAVAMWKVHWAKGFFVTKGGYEYTLVLLLVFAVLGLNGAVAYSLDAALGLVPGPIWFVLALVVAGVVAIGAAMGGQPSGVRRPT